MAVQPGVGARAAALQVAPAVPVGQAAVVGRAAPDHRAARVGVPVVLVAVDRVVLVDMADLAQLVAVPEVVQVRAAVAGRVALVARALPAAAVVEDRVGRVVRVQLDLEAPAATAEATQRAGRARVVLAAADLAGQARHGRAPAADHQGVDHLLELGTAAQPAGRMALQIERRSIGALGAEHRRAGAIGGRGRLATIVVLLLRTDIGRLVAFPTRAQAIDAATVEVTVATTSGATVALVMGVLVGPGIARVVVVGRRSVVQSRAQMPSAGQQKFERRAGRVGPSVPPTWSARQSRREKSSSGSTRVRCATRRSLRPSAPLFVAPTPTPRSLPRWSLKFRPASIRNARSD